MLDTFFSISKNLHNSVKTIINKTPVLASVHNKVIEIIEQTSGIFIEKWGPNFMAKFPKTAQSIEKVISGFKKFPLEHKIIEVEHEEISDTKIENIININDMKPKRDENLNKTIEPTTSTPITFSENKSSVKHPTINENIDENTDENAEIIENTNKSTEDTSEIIENTDENTEIIENTDFSLNNVSPTNKKPEEVTKLQNLNHEFLAKKFARNQILKITYIMYIGEKVWYSPREIFELSEKIGFKVLPGNVRKAVASKGTKLKLVKVRIKKGNKRNSKEISLTNEGKKYVLQHLL